MKKTSEIDMLHGGLAGKLVLFSLPIAATSILQQLFNSADTAVVGRFATSEALAAVGTNGEIIALFINLFSGISVGVNVLCASYIGMNHKERVKSALHSSMLLALILGAAMLVIGQAIAEPLLAMIDTPSDVMDLAVLYLRIYFLGSPFIMLYNFASAAIRAKGDSRTPLYALLLSGVLNVFLNLFFVIVCHLSVAGVALATDISNAVSAFMVIFALQKDPGPFHFSWKALSWNRQDIRRIFQIGLPAGIQGAVFCLSNVFIQAAINSFGSDAVAGSAAALNFEYFSYYMITAFSQAATTFISQNFAAEKQARCTRTFWLCLLFGTVFCAAVSVPCTIWGRQALAVYSNDPDVITWGMVRIVTVLSLEPLCSIFEIPAADLRGRGHSLTPAVETILGTVVFRLIWLATVYRRARTFRSIFLVYPVSWIITGAILLVTLFFAARKKSPVPSDTRL